MTTARSRTTVAIEVDTFMVRARIQSGLSILGPKVRSRTPVPVAVEQITVTARVPARVQLYGPQATARTFVRASVNEFAGTGVSRTRTTTPVRSGLPSDPPPPPPPPPPPAGAGLLGHPFWSAPLAAGAPIASTSANFVARLAFQVKTLSKTSTPIHGAYDPPGTVTTNGANTTRYAGAYALPIYRMPAGTPRVQVWATDTRKQHLQEMLDAGVPLPDPNLIPGGTIAPNGTDGSIVLLDLGTAELWELWQVRSRAEALALDPSLVIPTGYQWVCTQGGKMDDRTTHPGIWAAGGPTPGWFWGVAAAGTSKGGGMVTADDYYRDTIGHPLGLALPITGGDATTGEPKKLLPATRFDYRANIPGGVAAQPLAEHYRVAEGSRFRLPASFDIDAYIATLPVVTPGRYGTDPVTLRKVLVAVRDHGIIVNDSSDVVSFAAEHVKTFGTPYNPFTLAQAPVWGNFGWQLPWTSLVQVAAPTTDISVPGAG